MKSINTDSRSRKRLKFATSKQKSKLASADVYRRYKRRHGTTTASWREDKVHHARSNQPLKRRRLEESISEGKATSELSKEELERDTVDVVSDETTFAEELEIAIDRNGSELFKEFYRKVWPLVRSLPELVHHAEQIVQLMLDYMLSLEETPPQPTSASTDLTKPDNEVLRYQVNHATTDILHLLAVLARDLRHEIHPWIHTKIFPRIVGDLLNPPLPATGKQPVPLDVPVVEAVFRAMAYVIRYDSEKLLEETVDNEKEKKHPCLEPMRKYYGSTLGNKRELVRRLSAETFAPLIRKLKSGSAKSRHIRRVLRALDASMTHSQQACSSALQRINNDAVDGVAQLCLELAKGASGDLHSKGVFVVDCVLGSAMEADRLLSREVVSSFFSRLVTVLKPENGAKLFVDIKTQLSALEEKGNGVGSHPSSIIFLIRLTSEIIAQAKVMSENNAKESVMSIIQEITAKLLDQNLDKTCEESIAHLMCVSWDAFKQSPDALSFMRGVFSKLFECYSSERTVGLSERHYGSLAKSIFSGLPPEQALKTMGSMMLETALQAESDDDFISLVHGVACRRVTDTSLVYDDDTFFPANAQLCNTKPSLVSSLLGRILVPYQNPLDRIPQLTAAAKCTAFVGACPVDRAVFLKSYKKSSEWLSDLICRVPLNENMQKDDSVLLFSSLVESLAFLSSIALDRFPNAEEVEPCLLRVRNICLKFLVLNSSSICALKSCSLLCGVMSRLSKYISDDSNSVFEAITPNLHSFAHFKRLYTLRILASFPNKPFVLDHVNMDLSDDDGEPSSSPVNNQTGPSGNCALLDILLDVESLPIDLSSERSILSLLSRVEVLARSGKLPVIYVEVAACHLMGMLHVKFSPVWTPIIKTLGALLRSHGGTGWPFIFDRLSELTVVDGEKEIHQFEERTPSIAGSDPDGFDVTVHFHAVRVWEYSGGRKWPLFVRHVTAANEAGKVSVFEYREPCDASLTLWDLLENEPGLIVEHSRDIVPLVLNFFQHQYFISGDPDGIEIFGHKESSLLEK